MRYFLACFLTFTSFHTFCQLLTGPAISVAGHINGGYQSSHHTHYKLGAGYDVHLGYFMGNTGLEIAYETSKTHFDSETYSYYVPGYDESWGNEIDYVNEVSGVLRWALPVGTVKPYLQGHFGSLSFRHKDKIIVVEEVWDDEEEEWKDEKSTYSSDIDILGKGTKTGFGGGLLIETGDNLLVDLKIIKNTNKDRNKKTSGTMPATKYTIVGVSIGLTVVLGEE